MTADLSTAPESLGTVSSSKSPSAFRTITEVANELDLPQHVLRFWESKFAQIRPMKRRGGRRYYRPEDVVMLREIRHLLYVDGYTIRGVQKLLRQQNRKALAERPPRQAVDNAPPPAAAGDGTGPSAEPETPRVRERPLSTAHRKELLALLAELEELRALLPDRPARRAE